MQIFTGRKDKTEDKTKNEQETPQIPNELPILPVRGVVVYPLTVIPLSVSQERDIRLVDEAVTSGNRLIGISVVKDTQVENAGPGDLYTTGTFAVIHRLLRAPDGTVRLIVQGLERIRIKEFTTVEPYLRAHIEPAPEKIEKTVQVEALMRNTVDLFRKLVSLASYLPEEILLAAINIEDPRQLVYMLATSFQRMEIKDAQELLEFDHVADKLTKLNALITKELEVLELGKKIQTNAQGELEKTQREYILREQMRQIKKELGEQDEQAVEASEYEKKIAEAKMSPEAEKEAKRELERMRSMPTAAAEYSVIKTYLD
jgi:ATP-dependent Lon protease